MTRRILIAATIATPLVIAACLWLTTPITGAVG